MSYTKDYAELQQQLISPEASRENPVIDFAECRFESFAHKILPGADHYHCTTHHTDLKNDFSFYTEVGKIIHNVKMKDILVQENREFKYHLVKPKGGGKVKKIVFLFHGFNEKDWKKYLPWAKAICQGTGSSVVLFPIAFHMQRAPKHWSSKREMYELSTSRIKRFPNVVHSTLSNVAISMRLHSMPQRFIWSGLQTYYDVIQLIEECKDGRHPHIQKDFEFDIFAYSIGGFLAQILKLANHRHYFDRTKVCLFCSGATFNRLSPVSKFILDSEANVALYSFLVEHLDKILQKDHLLDHYLREGHLEGKVFYSMLDYQRFREFREGLFKTYEHQFYAISLKQDHVIPSFEIIHTLQGAYRDIHIPVEELDFDRPYTHESPFAPEKDPLRVDRDFDRVFKLVCDFLNG
ncbi:MAG: DUF6051 family protein [Breznakibacter sp.]